MKCEKCDTAVMGNHAHYKEVTALAKSKGSSIISKVPTGKVYCIGCVETKRKEMEGQLSIYDL